MDKIIGNILLILSVIFNDRILILISLKTDMYRFSRLAILDVEAIDKAYNKLIIENMRQLIYHVYFISLYSLKPFIGFLKGDSI